MKKIGILFCCLSLNSMAATVAIIDSGTDLNHSYFQNKAWLNPGEKEDAVDNDKNGLIDDLHGWNFAEDNRKLIDLKKYQGRFGPDVFKFFEVQARTLQGTASQEDLDYIKRVREDQKFLGELQVFGNYAHGTHVAGISAGFVDSAKVMVHKIIPTEAPKPFSGFFEIYSALEKKEKNPSQDGIKDKLVKYALEKLGSQQAVLLAPVGKYLSDKKAQIANCSFGSSAKAASQLLRPLLEKILGKLTDEQALSYASSFVTGAMNATEKEMVKKSKNTLFVIAAGNDGSNNDLSPVSPANIKTDNTITVAATVGISKLASFSNYGEKMVDLAAPGVGILSSAPEGKMVMMSGTSQAAPYVTSVAAEVQNINPKLSPKEIKEILMDTVDQKDFLAGKVKSAGVVNKKRALFAAEMSLKGNLKDATKKARSEVPDQIVDRFDVLVRGEIAEADLFVSSLPGLY